MKTFNRPLAACAAHLLTLVAAFVPMLASALDAGPLRLIGPSDQGEIVVAGTPPFDAASLQARIATANSYGVAGLNYDAALAGVQIRIAREPDGRTVMHLDRLPGLDHYDLLILFGDRDRLQLAEYRVDLREGRREFAGAPAGSSRYPTTSGATTATATTTPAALANAAPPAAATAPVPDRLAAVAPIGEAEPAVRAAVQAWARAWSERDVDRYAAAYAPDYSPHGSHAEWLAERRARILGRSRIEVAVDALQIEWRGDDTAVVRFQQSYRSEKLSERSAKTLTLVRSGTRWLITAEASTH